MCFLCIISGQLITSLPLDHFGLLELEKRPVTLLRLAGCAAALGGTVLYGLDPRRASTGTASKHLGEKDGTNTKSKTNEEATQSPATNASEKDVELDSIEIGVEGK